MFSQDILLTKVSVGGEVSNAKYHSSGHIYFTLKDQKGTLACVMFAGNRNGLSFPLKEGQQVVVSGSISIYERAGNYQLYATKIVQDGQGSLYEEFEKLKLKLEEKGMFSPIYKRKIPPYPTKVGIVTAPTGAAVQDIIQIAKRRNPYIQLILYPAIVQGENASKSIANGIKALDKTDVDIIIVGRGGGSLEDLWAFNEEAVAEAIFNASKPIVSAVGHETDTTIADFVSDLRAPTPSAAAELVIFEASAIDEKRYQYQRYMNRYMNQKIQKVKDKLERQKLRTSHASPHYRIKEERMYVIKMEEQMRMGIEKKIAYNRHKFAIMIEKFKGLSPLTKLNAGYCYVTDRDGKTVKSVKGLAISDIINIDMVDGTVKTRVLQLEPARREEA